MHGPLRNSSTVDQNTDGSDKKRESLIDGAGFPVLGPHRTRQPSYGSCETDRCQNVEQKELHPGPEHRHKIGSEVLDFGESPAIWPGMITQRLSKTPSHRTISSLFPCFDAPDKFQSIPDFPCKKSFLKICGGEARNS